MVVIASVLKTDVATVMVDTDWKLNELKFPKIIDKTHWLCLSDFS